MEPADRLCISKGGGLANCALLALSSLVTSFGGEQERPDQEALVASGVIDVCVDVCSTFAARGIEGLPDTHTAAVYFTLSILSKATKLSGCEVKIRGVAKALGFCLEHSLEYISEMGVSSGSAATRICVGVFGRDEGGSEFTFTQQHIDTMIFYMTDILRGKTAAHLKPDSTKMVALDLCTSPESINDLLRQSQLVSDFAPFELQYSKALPLHLLTGTSLAFCALPACAAAQH
jgi:hypothetical protein